MSQSPKLVIGLKSLTQTCDPLHAC